MNLTKYFRKIGRLVKSKHLNWAGKCVYLPVVIFGRKGIASLLIFTIIFSSFFADNNANAATYSFVQSSWAGGTDAGTTGIHPTNQSNWTKYSTNDANLSAGATLGLSASSYTVTDDGTLTTTGSATGGGFSNGTNSQTAVSGSGAGGSVKLSTSSSMDVGTGADGAVTISTAKNINTNTLASGRSCADGGDGVAYNASALTSNTATLSTTPAAGCLAANDKILIINLQGDGTNLSNVGNYEILTVQTISTNTITFTTNKTKYYGNGASDDTNIGTTTAKQRVIVQRIPQYTNVTISSGGSLTVDAWNGTKGGVLIFYASGTVDVQSGGSMSMSAQGYRSYTDYGAGESYNKYGPGTYDSNNLGGGGVFYDGGDSDIFTGGGYGTRGKSGNEDSGGETYGDANLADLFMGSAGATAAALARGGRGGGIIYISAGVILISGSLLNKGGDGGGVGGGSGGSVFITGNTLTLGTTKIDARGGTVTTGSAGGDGRIYLKSNDITGTTSPSATTATIAVTYNTSGTFTSAVINTVSAPSSWGNLSWTSSGTGIVTLKARSSANSDMSGATAWASCTNITSGQALSTGGCVTNGHQYIQYQASLSTADTSVTPSLDSVTIGYTAYPSSQTLTSSAYDTSDPNNVVAGLAWIEDATLPTGTGVTVSLRSAGTSGGLSGALWTDFTNVSSNCSKASSTVTCTNASIPAGMKDNSNDQWLQYKITLTSTGTNTPTVSSVSMVYVVNIAPEFDATFGTNGVTASQISDSGNADWGKVTISYKVRDQDTSSGTIGNQFKITPSFAYNIGGGWVNITGGYLGATDLNTKTVDDSVYNTYTATWNARSQIPNTYSITAKVRVTISDGELANATASATGADFTLDTKSPVSGATPLLVNASEPTPVITFSATDDSTLEMRVGTTADLSGANYEAYSETKLLGFSSGATIYAQFRDLYNNTTEIFSTAPPVTVSNIFFQDVSNVGTSDWREFFAWAVTDEPLLGFEQYKIYRSVNGGSFELFTTVTNRLFNYIVDFGLNQNSTYQYKVAVEDSYGNISFFSQASSVDTPDGTGGSDLAAPTLSSVSVSNITSSTATVTWTTNKLSTSTVYYSDANIYPGADKTIYDESIGVPSMVLTHTVTLSNLIPGTQYFFLAESEDVSSNMGQSASATHTFTTEDGPIISNVTTAEVFDNEATLTWNTNILADSNVYYSTLADFSDDVQVASSVLLTTNHRINLTNLASGATYYYYIKSTDAEANHAYDKNIISGLMYYYSFNTSSDGSAPVISGVDTALIGERGATIVWTTNEPATSKVEWGLTPSLGTNTTETSVYTREHAVVLTGLSLSTDYYYRVISKDKSNNTSFDDNSGNTYSFTTSDPTTVSSGGGKKILDNRDLTTPVISNIKVNSIGSSSAMVSFTTSKVTNQTINYGETTAYGSEESKLDIFTISHLVSLQNLVPQTTYNFKIKVVDVYGNIGLSDNMTFTTLASGESPAITGTDNSLEEFLASMSESQLASALASISSKNTLTPMIYGTDVTVQTDSQTATIEWATDKEANSLVSYAKASDYNQGGKMYSTTIGSPDGRTLRHKVEIENLSPSTTYHFQATSKGLLGAVAISKDEVFTTASLTPDINNAKIDSIDDSSAIISWETELPTKSFIEIINTATGEMKKVEDTSYIKNHVFKAEDLNESTSYNFKVKAMDDDGNTSKALAVSFTTPISVEAPKISFIKISTSIIPDRTEITQTIISWKTDKPATSQVFFSEGVSSDLFQSTTLDTTLVRDHIVITTALRSGLVYKIKAESKNVGGDVARSEPYTVLTPKPRGSVVDIIFKNLDETFGFLNGN